MKPEDLDKLIDRYSILLDPDSELLPKNRKFNVSTFVFPHYFFVTILRCPVAVIFFFQVNLLNVLVHLLNKN